MTFYVQLPNYPEWAIPMTKVVPMVYTEDAYDLSTVTWSVRCYHLWHIIPSTNPNLPNAVELRVDMEASATIPNPSNSAQPTAIPVYIDIDLVFFNERVAQEAVTNIS